MTVTKKFISACPSIPIHIYRMLYATITRIEKHKRNTAITEDDQTRSNENSFLLKMVSIDQVWSPLYGDDLKNA